MSDLQIIEAKENIASSPEAVWAALLEVESWKKWWDGNELSEVTPSWGKGASLIFQPGGPSTIYDFQPGNLLDFGGTNSGMVMHRCFKLEKSSNHTAMIYSFSVTGAGPIPPSQKNEERRSMELVLQNFKKLVESSSPPSQAPVSGKDPVSPSSKKWWEFWR
jgi:hypothetical protein